METKSAEEINDRCEIVFNDTEASIYTIKGGSKKLVTTVDTALEYNKENTFSYKIQKLNNSTHLVLKLNGEVFLSKVVDLPTSNVYFGCYTDKVDIKLY